MTKSRATTFKSSTKTQAFVLGSHSIRSRKDLINLGNDFIGKAYERKDVAGKADGREGVHGARP